MDLARQQRIREILEQLQAQLARENVNIELRGGDEALRRMLEEGAPATLYMIDVQGLHEDAAARSPILPVGDQITYRLLGWSMRGALPLFPNADIPEVGDIAITLHRMSAKEIGEYIIKHRPDLLTIIVIEIILASLRDGWKDAPPL